MSRSLSTSEFAQALGISESSVRRLTDAGHIKITRTKGGHRRIPISAAIRYVRETKPVIVRPDLLGLDSTFSGTGKSTDHSDKMLRLLESGNAAAVISFTQSLYANGMSVAELCDGPIRIAMQHIGERWPQDRRAIYIEHRALTLCVRALNQMRTAISAPKEPCVKAMGAGTPGNTYLLPTLMSALVLYDVGYYDTDLGPNTPLDVLADAVAEEQPKIVWLSVSDPLRSRVQEHELYQLAASVKQHGSTLVIGGRYAGELHTSGTSDWTYCASMQELHEIATRLIRD
jgi:excisionase family DNA binding protein